MPPWTGTFDAARSWLATPKPPSVYTFPRGYCEQTTRTRLEALLREHLAPAERESLLDAGAALSPEDAIALALQSPDM
jgi:hypothetical protein